LNLGILAHVDAGKTTLTERLLYAASVIDEVGSVDAGMTQTDSLALERQRGITIKSAVVSFAIDDVAVNLVDTPGHPDFIAEVERALRVLDGAVLVVSAVEGVQPQTRILMRALQRLRVPTVLFVNKIDRLGARHTAVLDAISSRLTAAIVPMGGVDRLGTPAAQFIPFGADALDFRANLIEVLADHDDALLEAWVADETHATYPRLRAELVTQTKRAQVHPVFFGSAITGAGVESLMTALMELLPAAMGDADRPASGRVFKIERGPAGEKVAYVRMFTGRVRTRDRVRFGRDGEQKVTAINVFDDGSVVRHDSVSAGRIGKLWGLSEIQVGDAIGTSHAAGDEPQFDPPTLETAVVPRNRGDKGALRVALDQLAEQDPLIHVRQDDMRQEVSVSLYGEIQKQVLQATLAGDYGIDVEFRETTTLCIERPAGSGEAVEILNAESNPFRATVGLRIDPAPIGSGIQFRLRVDHRSVPLYLYKNVDSFAETMGRYVRRTLQEGLFGWQVTDCAVTLIGCAYSSFDGPPATRGPLSSPADFRNLTPLVLMRALHRAGTVVCEPIVVARVDVPTPAVGAVQAAMARLGAIVEEQVLQPELATIRARMAVARMSGFQRQLPELTGGEGVIESSFAGYQHVRGDPPIRQRTTANPLHRAEYMMLIARQGTKV
jgi:ribosomal protection tetracycline resistance protein